MKLFVISDITEHTKEYGNVIFERVAKCSGSVPSCGTSQPEFAVKSDLPEPLNWILYALFARFPKRLRPFNSIQFLDI